MLREGALSFDDAIVLAREIMTAPHWKVTQLHHGWGTKREALEGWYLGIRHIPSVHYYEIGSRDDWSQIQARWLVKEPQAPSPDPGCPLCHGTGKVTVHLAWQEGGDTLAETRQQACHGC